MLVKHAAGDKANPWGSAPNRPVIIAAYRRGVLRAKVALSDLTCRSARIESMDAVKPGMLVWITLPGLEARPATVDWTSGFTAGLRFEAPLHPAVLDAILDGRIGSVH
ncbi:PilZ domain-containing protein [Novosphingobium sp.]|uniref:PilZ domain-containing protein n=1 Tax=Novosphingobium sp. TaxID=1874826 RepID=UPI003BAAF244